MWRILCNGSRKNRPKPAKRTRRKRTIEFMIGGATMKNLPVTLIIVLIILVACFAVHRYIETMAPTWQVTAAQQAAIDLHASEQNAHTDVQAHAERAQWFTSALLSFGGLVFMLVAAVGGVYAWTIYDKRRE